MRVENVIPINISSDRVNLAEWFFSMTDSEYRATTKDHLAFGTFTSPNGKHGAVIVEDIGGVLIINHYDEELGTRSMVQISSPQTRIWLFRLFPSTMSIFAVFELRAVSTGKSELVLTVETRVSSLLLKPMFESPMNRVIMNRHIRQEMAGFARDIIQKYG